jgi:hypothetical protein
MSKPWSVNEASYDQLARTWVKRTNARRYFRRAASKARRVGLKRDQRRQEEDR